MALIKCTECGKENEDALEYCKYCNMRIVPYKRVEKSNKSNDDKKKSALKSWAEKRKHYDGFAWAIVSFLCLCFKQSRPITILAVIESMILFIVYLIKNNKKFALPIIGIILDIFVLYVYIGYYLF